ncbi:MAG TPA: ATP-dependent helicase [Verrucomicrobiae bacterium]|nr:ATP-dependent helicase [Verrucomicrobiae bacterium]
MRFLSELNALQRLAVEASDREVLIIAGPGTGKTKTLTARIAYVLENGAKPNDIVALTFTNKAAREMRERLADLLRDDTRLPKICTFHALGADLLQRSGDTRPLIKPAEQQELIRGLSRPQEFKNITLRELTLLISCAKASRNGPVNEAIAGLLEQYEEALASHGCYDFDDLLIKAVERLRSSIDKRLSYMYVLVDEFQDTSELQYELLKLLSSGGRVFAIGDPNQSIYSFRGAGAEMFTRFRLDFSDVKEVALTENYRSRPEIVQLANAIFPGSPQLIPQTDELGHVQAMKTLNGYSEAAYVLREIEQGIGGSTMLNASGHQDVRQPRNYAVLYRTHQAGRIIQKVFAEGSVPYQIAGEDSPYERPEVQAIITELRAVRDLKSRSVYDFAQQTIERLQLPSEKVVQFLGTLVQFGNNIEACLQHIDDIAEQEFYDPSVDAVTLMTIHASKGLEFAHVFLIAAEEGILPKVTSKDAGNVEEERRLFYVAATRAKESLTILHTKSRGVESMTPSRFITGLPDAVLPRIVDPDFSVLERRQQKRRAQRAQTSLF